ncbi:YggT family protein [Facklamia miroungae]|uniref:YggT family protein n=1 Tax=Facklamia miroungae TaxID=120956 RepID=A0A1G7TUC1_9LACT|nr:YggT family protein [Facklamia miroungae]NKZ29973.1 YggT family protein [Facklamia miroungae]SDG38843.1 YggT family protein [Facklamia miroungae]
MNLLGIISVVTTLFRVYQWVLILYALLSWLPGARESSIGHLITRLASPFLDIFDRFIPPIGPISINVIIALFTLSLIERGVISLIVMVFG